MINDGLDDPFFYTKAACVWEKIHIYRQYDKEKTFCGLRFCLLGKTCQID